MAVALHLRAGGSRSP